MSRLIYSIIAIIAILALCGTIYAAQSNPPKRIYRGPESGLPSTMPMGVPAMTTDTHRVFVGYSEGKAEVEMMGNKGHPFGYPSLDAMQKIPAANIPDIRLKGYTVAGLPAITAVQGDTAFVTDALAPTFLTTVVGGGAVVTPVFYNGSNWVGY